MAIDESRVSLVLLAAGRSMRFGADKLVQPLAGRPLVHHAAATLSRIGFACRIAVIGSADLGLSDFPFRCVRSTHGAPMSESIRRGVAAAADSDSDACLIALADMPFVPESHFRALAAAHHTSITASRFAELKTVPAIFSRDMFPMLCALSGDRGAVGLLSEAPGVPADPSWMRDIDTPADLAQARTGQLGNDLTPGEAA